jgi:ankyrin repeat protein
MRMKFTLALVLIAFGVSGQEQSAADRFYQAIRNDNLSTLRALVGEFGANAKDPQGHTPLMLAAAFGSPEAMQLLVGSGADVKTVSSAGITALHWATGDVRKVRLLLDRGADVRASSQLGRTPLLVAASSNGTMETVGLLLEKGADINAADAVGVTPLIAAASVDDLAVAKVLLVKGADVNAKANVGQSATALMGAAFNGNAELTRLILARNAKIDVVSADHGAMVKNGPVLFGNVTALHMATSSGGAEVVKLLLDAGAAVDAQDVRGMTPLMWSVSTDHPEPRIVRMLLDKGADASSRSKLSENTLDWARKFNHPRVLAELKLPLVAASARSPLTTSGDKPRTPREAVERSMPLLRGASSRVLTDGGCVACHAQPMTVMAAELALARGWRVERADIASSQTVATLLGAAQNLLQGREGGGSPDTQLYMAIMMAAQDAPPSLATDALVHFLAGKQRQTGNWRGIGATRAPIQDGDFSRTAMGIRTLAAYGPPARKVELAKRIERAATWLARQTPLTTEDRVMQLLGLKWANANARARESRIRELMAAQRSDGGWAQTPYLASDAYATGQVLYVLRELGMPASDPAVQSGTSFLLRTQEQDGSWYVKSRAMKIQPYFESGFPHGHDQWISQTATSWAAMALSLTAQEPPVVAAASPAKR